MTISVIYENTQYDKRCKPGWGFSSLIKLGEKNILFDTGAEGRILLHNMEKLNIDPLEIDGIFLSHEHWDHAGGLTDLLKSNEKAGVYLLKSFSREFINELEFSGRKIVQIDAPYEIFEGIHSTGPLGDKVEEQSLVARMDKGLLVIAGCAHPGLVEIARKATEIFKQDIYILLGGFHLLDKKDSEIKSVIHQLKDLGVQKVGPCHCTGYAAIDLFRKEFKKDFIEIGAGRVIPFEE